MEAIKDTISNLLKAWEAKKVPDTQADPQEAVKKIFAKNEAGHIEFHYFRNGVMGLKVDSSTRLYYLNLKKRELLEKLRKSSSLEIKDLRFSIGETK